MSNTQSTTGSSISSSDPSSRLERLYSILPDGGGRSPADYQQMLARLQESAPYLLYLRLFAPYSPIIVTAMSAALRSFALWVSARTGSLPIIEQAFRHLAALLPLETIDITLPDSFMERDVASLRLTRVDEFFPILRELQPARRGSRSSVQDSLRTTTMTMVRSSRWTLSRNNSTIIQELGIQASIEQTPDATFNGKHLEPLFALRNLTTLQILQRGMHASDSRLPRPVSSALPRAADPRMTLDADLFRLPPTLRNSLACVGSDQRALEVLKVGPAPIVDPQGVASFLVDPFPHLGYVKHDNMPFSAILLAAPGVPQGEVDEIAAEAECGDHWDQVYKPCIPAMANWRGIDRERTLDEVDANVIKSWHMGGRRPR
ncbi:hypothetical protein LXA43DRAFT_1062068 [Ganoderma leucocontextum]|nr:hypothetical protein LXA43DRAFT_1062068 [Ganoderma leucocontextum]